MEMWDSGAKHYSDGETNAKTLSIFPLFLLCSLTLHRQAQQALARARVAFAGVTQGRRARVPLCERYIRTFSLFFAIRMRGTLVPVTRRLM